MGKKIKSSGRSRLRAKLSFDDGFAEKPIYSIKAFTNEKDKGINMANLILDNFGISMQDRLEKEQREFEEMNEDMDELEKKVDKIKPIEWTRDEKGRIISPYSSKLKELE